MNIPKIAALVPMKGHSERVPHKNIRPLAGKPACHWVLEKLNDCKYIEEIIVDTDDEEIADIVKCFPKVKLLNRPDFLLGDMVSIQPLIEYDIQHSSCDFFLQTHSTNPCVEPETYEKAIEAFRLLHEECDLDLCASMGLLSREQIIFLRWTMTRILRAIRFLSIWKERKRYLHTKIR